MAGTMPVQQLHQIFTHEIDGYLGRLERKSREMTSVEGSSLSQQMRRLSDRSDGGSLCPPDDRQIGHIRDMFMGLTEAVLGRLADHATHWGPEAEGMEEPDQMRRELQAKNRELEAQLGEKSKEEANLMQRIINSNIQHELMERLRNIQEKMGAVEATVVDLEQRKSNLEHVEALQEQAPSRAEMLLAGPKATDAADEEEEDQKRWEEALEALRDGEQMCKRMRRHAAGA